MKVFLGMNILLFGKGHYCHIEGTKSPKYPVFHYFFPDLAKIEEKMEFSNSVVEYK
jgi:hypothetical protein